jgi:hypothetical protein
MRFSSARDVEAADCLALELDDSVLCQRVLEAPAEALALRRVVPAAERRDHVRPQRSFREREQPLPIAVACGSQRERSVPANGSHGAALCAPRGRVLRTK